LAWRLLQQYLLRRTRESAAAPTADELTNDRYGRFRLLVHDRGNGTGGRGDGDGGREGQRHARELRVQAVVNGEQCIAARPLPTCDCEVDQCLLGLTEVLVSIGFCEARVDLIVEPDRRVLGRALHHCKSAARHLLRH